MQNSLLGSGFACALIIAAPASTQADTISDSAINTYFAPLTVIEDHPQCNAPGQTAFEITFRTDTLDYRSYNKELTHRALVDGDGDTIISGIEPNRRCFVTERRGGDVFQVEYECGEDEDQIPQSPVDEVVFDKISLSGRFVACQSLVDFDLVENSWEVAVLDNDAAEDVSAVYAGSFLEYPLETCSAKDDHYATTARFTYALADIPSTARSRAGQHLRFGTGDQYTVPSARFVLFVSGIPIARRYTPERDFFADIDAFFIVTVDGDSGCENGVCKPPPIVREAWRDSLPRACE